MKVQARLNNYRRSPKKVRELAPLIRGKQAEEVLVQLQHVCKGSAADMRKLVASAMANAENNFNLDKKNLVVSEVLVQEGPTMKRWRARAHGRAAQILKRTCHIIITVEDKRVEEVTKPPVKKDK